MTVNREMPRYICHKRVWALKIASVQEGVKDKNSALLTFADEGYAPIHVDFDWYYRHKPEAGGYYVVYKDGYKSFSPAAAFEDGYTLQGAAQAQPSGDTGELPALDERTTFDQWFCRERALPMDADTTQYDEAFLAYRAWQARAALAVQASCQAPAAAGDARDAARWRFARTIFAIEDIEDALAYAAGGIADEEHNARADRAIDVAMPAGREGRRQVRPVAGAVREPVNGEGWNVHWWNESMRLMLPNGMRIDGYQRYRNGTIQLTIKNDAQRAKGDA